ncbi:hypothetical protein [Comamonas koreensis]|uniref:Uncharacterized protein n=1 Tax=Comamonas koreensis TaxID=160825 RepID=A0AAW4XQS8_9BURK|nr:hypothetical protein [Comamonas koreensis]MCD2163515.1 hypothetical protein [Comamonas koreensis]MCD2163518.1 hypothetical protein [Comamonas koreensis]
MNFAETAALSTPARRSARGYVDFTQVLPQHRPMDVRLANWGRWCHGPMRRDVSPMFRGMPREPQLRQPGDVPAELMDPMDAAKVAKAVAGLPEKHRAVLNWCYVLDPRSKEASPARASKKLGTSLQGLADLLRDARQMLINRGA